jgi:LacI family transcriptional regulator
MAVTIRDVAKRAGVSVATVSRALNQSGPVREDTRQRIETAARALEYRPNNAARSLITRRTRMMGVLLPDLHGEFFSELIRGIDQAAQAEGYHLLLSSSHDDSTELKAALQGMHGRVDGLVVMAPTVEAAVLKDLLPRNVPIVLLNTSDRDLPWSSLRIDSYGGARAIVTHLIDHGHRRIGMIEGPSGNIDASERLRGYRAALKEAGLETDPGVEVAGAFTGSSGYRGAQALLGLEERPTAIFAANDAMAIGALSALRAADVAVPEEMALVGFDDVSSTQYMIPSLSSVHGQITDLGAQAVVRLAEEVAGRAVPASPQKTIPATLVLRRSCGCGPGDRERAEWERKREVHSKKEVV